MNFSSHIKSVSDEMEVALYEDREILLCTLWKCLEETKDLLKVSSLDFWISQLEAVSLDSFPTTTFGVGELRSWCKQKPETRSNLESFMIRTSELLLTYCSEDDVCEAQCNFHYYYHIGSGTVFKQSWMGFTRNMPFILDFSSEVRVAHINELNVDKSEYYRTT